MKRQLEVLVKGIIASRTDRNYVEPIGLVAKPKSITKTDMIRNTQALGSPAILPMLSPATEPSQEGAIDPLQSPIGLENG